MVFCNADKYETKKQMRNVTILILIDGFLQYCYAKKAPNTYKVTILILIDGFLQYVFLKAKKLQEESHNPYFNRWFSAMELHSISQIKYLCHNPYFNRWFSAIISIFPVKVSIR